MTRAEMVELLRVRGVSDPRVLEAFNSVPREASVTSDDPYADTPLPIGLGQTISQPYAVALTVAALELRATGSRSAPDRDTPPRCSPSCVHGS